jgi:hypothetical protein
MFTSSALLSLLFSIVIVGLVVWLLLWGLKEVGIPEPFNKIAKVVIIIFAVFFLISKLLPFIN